MKNNDCRAVEAHAFNPSIREAGAAGSLRVQGQPGLQSECQEDTQRNPISKNQKKKKKKKGKKKKKKKKGNL